MAKVETLNSDLNGNENDGENEKLEDLQNAVKYLFDKRDKLTELANDIVAKDAFDHLKYVEFSFEKIDAEHQKMFHEVFTNILKNECSNTFGVEPKKNENDNKTQTNETNTEARIKNLTRSLDILNNSSFDTPYYHNALKSNKTYFDSIFQLINNIVNANNKEDELMNSLLQSSFALIESTTKTFYNCKKDWKKYGLIDLATRVGEEYNVAILRYNCALIIRNLHDYNKDESDDDPGFKITLDGPDDVKLTNYKNACKYLIEASKNFDEMIKSHRVLRAFQCLIYNKKMYSLLDSESKTLLVAPVVGFLNHISEMTFTELKRNHSNGHNVIKLMTYMHTLIQNLILEYCYDYLDFCLKYNQQEHSIKILTDLFNHPSILNTEKLFKDEDTLWKFLHKRILYACLATITALRLFANKFRNNWSYLTYKSNDKFYETIQKYYKEMIEAFFRPIICTFDYVDDEDNKEFEYFKSYYNIEVEETRTTAVKAIVDKLSFYGEKPELVIQHRYAIYAIYFLWMYAYNIERNFCNHTKEFLDVSYKIVKYYYNELASLFNNINTNNDNIYADTNIRIVQVTDIIGLIFFKIANLAYTSIKFCIDFHDQAKDFLKLLIEIFKNNVFLTAFLKNPSHPLIKYIIENFYCFLSASISNISNAAYKYRDLWKNMDTFDLLLKLAKKVEPLKLGQDMLAYRTIANIATKDDLNNFSTSLHILEKFTKVLESFCSLYSNEDQIEPVKIDLFESEGETVEVLCVSSWNFTVIIDVLHNLSVNESLKVLIYNILNVKEYLRIVIYNGNEIEQEFALKLLRQLCFDKKIAEHVLNDVDLIKFIREILEKKDKKTSKSLIKNCEGILFLLNSDNKKPSTVRNKDLKHIMISYNSESQQYCLQIKTELESLGYKIWIDVENIHGSTIDAMDKAVENSWCVLVCMTEKYKASVNCRLEAEYAFKLGKPFVPLIMQEKYKPDEWLGIMMGTKIYIDFTKYEFDECMTRLVKEIKNVFIDDSVPVKNVEKELEKKTENKTELKDDIIEKKVLYTTSVKNNDELNSNNEADKARHENVPLKVQFNSTTNKSQRYIRTWNEDDVIEWFEERNINKVIKEALTPCDGYALMELYRLAHDSADFLYNTLRSDTKANLRDIIYFVSQLKLIFL